MGAQTPARRKKTARELAEQFQTSTRHVRRLIAEPRADFLVRAAANRARAVELRQQGMTYKQIADEMGSTSGTVGTWLREARRMVREGHPPELPRLPAAVVVDQAGDTAANAVDLTQPVNQGKQDDESGGRAAAVVDRPVFMGRGRSGSNDKALFNDLRTWAYGAVVDHETVESFQVAVLAEAHDINLHPMPAAPQYWYGCSGREVERIAGAVTEWVWPRRQTFLEERQTSS